MEPITLALALTASLVKVGEKLLDKAGVYDPAGDLLKKWIQKDYNKAKAQEALQKCIANVVDELGQVSPRAVERMTQVWKFEGQESDAYDLLAATAVVMDQPDAKKNPRSACAGF
jgi:hypothetical protein